MEEKAGCALREVPSAAAAASTTHYGSAGAYADELRKWLFATQCWTFCHHMATMHSLSYLASCMNYQPGLPLPVPRIPPGSTAASLVPSATSASGQFMQRRVIPSFSRRILAEVIDSVFAFAAKLFIVYFLVEIGIV